MVSWPTSAISAEPTCKPLNETEYLNRSPTSRATGSSPLRPFWGAVHGTANDRLAERRRNGMRDTPLPRRPRKQRRRNRRESRLRYVGRLSGDRGRRVAIRKADLEATSLPSLNW